MEEEDRGAKHSMTTDETRRLHRLEDQLDRLRCRVEALERQRGSAVGVDGTTDTSHKAPAGD